MSYLNNICEEALKGIDEGQEVYTVGKLLGALDNIIRPNMTEDEIKGSVMQIALELTSDMEPKWQVVAERLYIDKLYNKVRKKRGLRENDDLYSDLYGFIKDLTKTCLETKHFQVCDVGVCSHRRCFLKWGSQ